MQCGMVVREGGTGAREGWEGKGPHYKLGEGKWKEGTEGTRTSRKNRQKIWLLEKMLVLVP